jgi:hypothetical protein
MKVITRSVFWRISAWQVRAKSQLVPTPFDYCPGGSQSKAQATRINDLYQVNDACCFVNGRVPTE